MLMPSIFGEDLFDDWMNWPWSRSYNYNTVMKTDVRDTKDGYELDIDMPGFAKEDIKAELKDGYLTISAASKKDNDQKDENGKYIRRDRYAGSCSRSFYVGDQISQEDVKAKLENGILKLSIPKKEEKPAVEENKYISIEG